MFHVRSFLLLGLKFSWHPVDTGFMLKYWSCRTDVGSFSILKMDNQFLLNFDKKCIGTYDSPEEAANAVSEGTVDPFTLPSGEIVHDTFALNVPSNLDGWSCVLQHQ